MSERTALAEPRSAAAERIGRERDVTLLELLDRLLEGGVAIHGEVTLAVADVDLVRVGLRVVVASVDALERAADEPAPESWYPSKQIMDRIQRLLAYTAAATR